MKVQPLCLLHTVIGPTDNVLKILQNRLACGFPNDYLDNIPNLDALLDKHPCATFLAKAQGESMTERGIVDGSLLIIDRAMKPTNMSTIVASLNGELTVKVIDLKQKLLRAANKKQKPIPFPDDINALCEGVVTFCINPQGNTSFAC